MSEQLIKASKEGDLKAVQEMLNKGADINYNDSIGRNALLWAAHNGHLPVVKYLLTKNNPKANLIEENIYKNTALLLAAANGHTETVKYLLTEADPKSSLTERNLYGNTALHMAAGNGQIQTVKYLLTEAKANLTEKNGCNNTALLLAAANSQTQMVKYLVNEAIPKASLNERNSSGNTALLMAAATSQTETLHYLLTEANPKASLSEKNKDGDTALLMAATHGNIKNLKYLLTEAVPKASLTEKDNHGNTALLMAAIHAQTETVKYLLMEASPKASINERNNEGRSALALSAIYEHSHVDTIIFLLSQGAYIDTLSSKGKTPKQECQGDEGINTLKAFPLLKAAEDLIQASMEKETKVNIEAILATLGMAVNARSVNQKGNTALHLAILHENIKVILSLLEAGASFDITNDDRLTPYDLAIMSKIPAVNMPGYLFKAKLLAKELTLQIQDGKNENTINRVKKLDTPSIKSIFGLEIHCDTEPMEMKKSKDEVKKEMAVEPKTKGNAEKVEKLKSELELNISKAIESYDDLEGIDKQKVGFQLGSILAQPENAPLDAVKAYEILIQINKNSPEFAKANVLIYRMLLGNHLLLTKSIKTNGLGLKTEEEIIPLNPKDEATWEQEKHSQELTLRALIKHLLYSGLQDEPLKNYLAAYTLGNNNGIAADGLDDFEHFKNPESCIAFIDAMKNEEFVFTRNYKAKEKEIEVQKSENDKQEKEIETLKLEMEVLKAKIATLRAGSGAPRAAPLLAQFQSGSDANKAPAKASDQSVQNNNGSVPKSKCQ